ncbi:MAG: transposase, partial [Propionibacteriaceae bacterium]
MTQADDSGLNLFDDNASAAGNFPSALRGYDRKAVDEYVRGLEHRLVELQQRHRDVDSRVRELEDDLAEAQRSSTGASADPATHTAGRAGELFRVAQEEARAIRA